MDTAHRGLAGRSTLSYICMEQALNVPTISFTVTDCRMPARECPGRPTSRELIDSMLKELVPVEML
jgi:hypothetical protein